jgi:hypothetical protein
VQESRVMIGIALFCFPIPQNGRDAQSLVANLELILRWRIGVLRETLDFELTDTLSGNYSPFFCFDFYVRWLVCFA